MQTYHIILQLAKILAPHIKLRPRIASFLLCSALRWNSRVSVSVLPMIKGLKNLFYLRYTPHFPMEDLLPEV